MWASQISKQFWKWNAGVLLALGVFVWLRSMPSNFVFWPGAYFLSIWALSHSLPMAFGAFHSEQRMLTKSLLLLALVFGLFHWVLTGSLILLLERLFQFEEHYTMRDIGQYFRESWYYAIEGVLVCLGYFVVFQGLNLADRLSEERERHASVLAELRTSDLKMLKSELNPHFLYNAMNGISMKVRLQENKTAINMIAALTDLLRTVLSSRKVHLTSLEEEIAYLHKYLSIEEARFGKQARMELHFPEETKEALVPPLILQPLVENAFKHGLPVGDEQTYIRVMARREERSLILEVFNASNIKKKIITEENRGGIGLSNVIHRLRQVYGVDFRFQVLNQSDGVLCKLTVPFRQ